MNSKGHDGFSNLSNLRAAWLEIFEENPRHSVGNRFWAVILPSGYYWKVARRWMAQVTLDFEFELQGAPLTNGTFTNLKTRADLANYTTTTKTGDDGRCWDPGRPDPCTLNVRLTGEIESEVSSCPAPVGANSLTNQSDREVTVQVTLEGDQVLGFLDTTLTLSPGETKTIPFLFNQCGRLGDFSGDVVYRVVAPAQFAGDVYRFPYSISYQPPGGIEVSPLGLSHTLAPGQSGESCQVGSLSLENSSPVAITVDFSSNLPLTVAPNPLTIPAGETLGAAVSVPCSTETALSGQLFVTARETGQLRTVSVDVDIASVEIPDISGSRRGTYAWSGTGGLFDPRCHHDHAGNIQVTISPEANDPTGRRFTGTGHLTGFQIRNLETCEVATSVVVLQSNCTVEGFIDDQGVIHGSFVMVLENGIPTGLVFEWTGTFDGTTLTGNFTNGSGAFTLR